jgi:hypothetical protein
MLWLIPHQYRPPANVDLEREIEHRAWFQVLGFVDENSPSPLLNAIRYFNFPVYSHYKEQFEHPPFWIRQFPLVFNPEDPDAVRSYGTLLCALTEGALTFSLSGLSGPHRLPRHAASRLLAIQLDTSTTAKAPEVWTDNAHPGRLLVHATFPPDRVTLPTSGAATTPALPPRHCETLLDAVSQYWRGLESTWRDEKLGGLVELIQQQNASLPRWPIADALSHALEEPRTAELDELAASLDAFLAFNWQLGFTRICYLPLTIEVTNPSDALPPSWGGAVVVFKDDVQLLDTGSRSLNTDVLDLLRPLRILVDAAGPNIIIPDLAQFLRDNERYKAGLQALEDAWHGVFHDEGDFAKSVGKLLEETAALHSPTEETVADLSMERIKAHVLWLQSRARLVKEFRSAWNQRKDPLTEVPPGTIFPSVGGGFDPVQVFRYLNILLSRSSFSLELQVDEPLLGGIPRLDENVFFRIVFEVAQNARAAAAEAGRSSSSFRLTVTLPDPQTLRLRMIDTSGGRFPETLLGRLDQAKLNQFRLVNSPGRGLGLLLALRYVTAASGSMHMKRLPDGLEVLVDIPLPNEA